MECKIKSHCLWDFFEYVCRFWGIVTAVGEYSLMNKQFTAKDMHIHANSTDLGVDLPILSRLKRLTTLHTTSTTFLQF